MTRTNSRFTRGRSEYGGHSCGTTRAAFRSDSLLGWLAGLLLLCAVPVGAQQPPTEPTPPPILARLSADRSPLYQQELFRLVLTIYTLEPDLGRQVTITRLPPPDQLRLEPFQELPMTEATLGGRAYQARRFQCRARAPAAGTVTAAPLLRGTILRVARNYFFTQQHERPIDIPIDPLTLEFRPLPPAGQPPGFSGAVGQFRLQVTASPTNVAVGDLITVTTTLEGEGVLDGIRPPAIAATPHLKVYDVKPVPGSADGRWVFQQTVIPLSTEARTLPALGFSYFDPRASAYRQLTDGPFVLTFHAERAPVGQTYSPPVAAAVAAAPGAEPDLPPLRRTVPAWYRPVPAGWRRHARVTDADADRTFAAAVAAQTQGRLPEAISRYAEILARGVTAPALCFNLAWAAFAAGDTPGAILNFRRTLYFHPWDCAAWFGLRAACARAGTTPPALPPPDRWLILLPRAAWVLIAAGAGSVLVLAPLTGWVLRRRRPAGSSRGRGGGWRRRLAGSAGLLVLISLLGVRSWLVLEAGGESVVTAARTGARLAPNETARLLFPLKPGAFVETEATDREWVRVRSADGIGWVPATALQRVRPVRLPEP